MHLLVCLLAELLGLMSVGHVKKLQVFVWLWSVNFMEC